MGGWYWWRNVGSDMGEDVGDGTGNWWKRGCGDGDGGDRGGGGGGNGVVECMGRVRRVAGVVERRRERRIPTLETVIPVDTGEPPAVTFSLIVLRDGDAAIETVIGGVIVRGDDCVAWLCGNGRVGGGGGGGV